ncbi:MAG: M10 family metallopeptidase C-terminal domain-containing protein [Caulobacteraceae bacterium]
MAKVTFTAAIDMAALDLAGWLDTTPTNTSTTSMTFSTPGQTVVLHGSGFAYAGGNAIAGTITSVDATGLVSGTITNVSISVGDVGSILLFSGDPSGDLIDLVFGGKDTIIGGNFVDILMGFGGNDTLRGNGRTDTLVGGGGGDKLEGGFGIDTYDYNSIKDSTAAKSDLIVDLVNNDIIDLSGLHVKKLGDITKVYDSGTDTTTFSIDCRNDGSVDMVIVANGHHTDYVNFVI